jgi:NADP-dependent 3-hydroxy acid dehydrogenase YdfG
MIGNEMFTDEVVVITGAGRGLGREMALAFAKHRARLALISRTEVELEKVAREIRAAGGRAGVYPADVAVESIISETVAAIERKVGRVDLLVNNAGLWFHGPADKVRPEDVDRLLAVNLKGVMFTTKAVLSGMLSERAGHIINICSTSGREGKADQTLYCATKFAVRGYTEALRAELKGSGVRITGFYPGGMQTGFFDGAAAKVDTRGFMKPKEVARLVVTIASVPTDMVVSEIVVERMSKF